jgi:hypothetical protein
LSDNVRFRHQNRFKIGTSREAAMVDVVNLTV